jgi:hypothetical protein
MKFVLGLLLGFITLMYWAAMLKNIPHMWKVVHSKEWIAIHTNILISKIGVMIIFILGGIIGLFLLKWSMQLLHIMN